MNNDGKTTKRRKMLDSNQSRKVVPLLKTGN
jgi:hypothetical protein